MHKLLQIPFLKVSVTFICCERERFEAETRDFHPPISKETISWANGVFASQKDKDWISCYIVRVSEMDDGLIVHELIHAAYHICWELGIWNSEDHQEMVARVAQALFYEVRNNEDIDYLIDDKIKKNMKKLIWWKPIDWEVFYYISDWFTNKCIMSKDDEVCANNIMLWNFFQTEDWADLVRELIAYINKNRDGDKWYASVDEEELQSYLILCYNETQWNQERKRLLPNYELIEENLST